MRVLWTEGMFLTPHHLQAAERAAQEELRARLRALPLPAWGVAALDIDAGALAAGCFRVRALEAVLPDGTWLACTPDDPPLERALHDVSAAGIGVHVALPAWHLHAPNVAADDDPLARAARFRVVDVEVHDTAGDAGARTIQAVRLAPVLLLDGEPGEGLVRLPIARVHRDGAGGWVLSEDFVPRLLRAQASPGLRALVEGVLADVVARRRALAHDGALDETGSVSPRSLFAWWRLRAFDAGIARLEHVLSLGDAAPERWFEALRLLAADLGGSDEPPSELPRFRPDDPYGCCAAVVAVVRERLGRQAPSGAVVVELSLSQGVWQGCLPDDPALARASWVLVLGGVDAPLPDDVRRAVRVAAPDEIGRLVRMKLDGVSTVELPGPPPGVPSRRSARFLGLRASGLVWRRIAEARALAVHLPAAVPATRVELVGVP